jgi:hypothetical protein
MNMLDLTKTEHMNNTTNTQNNLTASVAALAAVSVFLQACKKEQVGLYEVNEVQLLPDAAGKDKLKSNQQFVSILYTNLFQTGLSGVDVFELDQLFQSIGDKDLAKEVLISNFFNDSSVQLPSVLEMNSDLNTFIENTYKRFFIRMPNEAEKTWLRNFIQANPYVTPEIVYFSFALSNEYKYY